MTVSELKNSLSRVVGAVYRNETRVIVAKHGIPIAAIISAADLDRLARYEQRRAERFELIDKLREAFKDVPPDEIERETDRIVAELRGKASESQEHEQESEDPFAVIARAREAFKDVPPEEIEQATDRIIARIRAENRAAREAMAATG